MSNGFCVHFDRRRIVTLPRRRATRALLCLAAAVLMAGCKPSYPPPDGFVESCYGGDFKKHLDGSIPRISIRIPLTESQWPDLAESLRQFSTQQNLDFFDTSLKLDHAHVLGLSVCSARGLQIHAADAVWKSTTRGDGDPGYTTVLLYSFKNFETRAVAEALVTHLQSRHAEASVQRNEAPRTPGGP
jgi:hypothetical protein